MANRVTGDEVKEIISTTLTSVMLAPFITAANLLITAKCASAGYSDVELKELERWLSAHFTAIRSPSSTITEKQVGDAREKYATKASGNDGVLLASTPYGEQVLVLDYLGCLRNLGRARPVFRTFGAEHADFTEDTTL